MASITVSKACSGKCKGVSCATTPRVWVVAACEGMILLFEKDIQGELLPIIKNEPGVFASLEQFQKTIDNADQENSFDQLIIVGSNNDIAWIHASLPQSAMHHIVAEIEYPLISGWFKMKDFILLSNALKNIFSG